MPLVVRSKTTRDARDRPSRPVRSSRSVLPFGPPRAPDPRVADDVFPFSSSRREQRMTKTISSRDSRRLSQRRVRLERARLRRAARRCGGARRASGAVPAARGGYVPARAPKPGGVPGAPAARKAKTRRTRRVSRRRHTAGARRRDVRARHLNRRERRPHADRPPVRDPRVPVPGRARGGGGAASGAYVVQTPGGGAATPGGGAAQPPGGVASVGDVSVSNGLLTDAAIAAAAADMTHVVDERGRACRKKDWLAHERKLLAECLFRAVALAKREPPAEPALATRDDFEALARLFAETASPALATAAADVRAPPRRWRAARRSGPGRRAPDRRSEARGPGRVRSQAIEGDVWKKRRARRRRASGAWTSSATSPRGGGRTARGARDSVRDARGGDAGRRRGRGRVPLGSRRRRRRRRRGGSGAGGCLGGGGGAVPPRARRRRRRRRCGDGRREPPPRRRWAAGSAG